MTRNYNNHKLQTDPLNCEGEPQNTYSPKASERQFKLSNQLSLLHQYDCKTCSLNIKSYTIKLIKYGQEIPQSQKIHQPRGGS